MGRMVPRRRSTSTAARRATAAARGLVFGLVRFDLDTIPAGATITSAKLVLTSVTGFAFNGDPVHRALFLSDDSWNEASVVWPGPDNGVVRAGSSQDSWTIFGVPLGTSPNVLGVASAFENLGCRPRARVHPRLWGFDKPRVTDRNRAGRRHEALAADPLDPVWVGEHRRVCPRRDGAGVLPALRIQGRTHPQRAAIGRRLHDLDASHADPCGSDREFHDRDRARRTPARPT